MSEKLRRNLTTALIVCYIVFYFAFPGTAATRYLGLICACFLSLIISGVYAWTHRDDKSILRAEAIADALIIIVAVILYIRYLRVI